jgi:hypothetical protein
MPLEFSTTLKEVNSGECPQNFKGNYFPPRILCLDKLSIKITYSRLKKFKFNLPITESEG